MGMAIDAVKRVRTVVDGKVEVDVKRYARVEKIPGGEMEDCKVTVALFCLFFLPLPRRRRSRDMLPRF